MSGFSGLARVFMLRDLPAMLPRGGIGVPRCVNMGDPAMEQDFLEKLKEEIKALEEELHVQLPRELKIAREHGDLSENAEYDAAKERQGYVNARLGQLRKRLGELSMIDMSKIPRDRVSLGSEVHLYEIEKKANVVYRLVMSEEADVQRGFISTTSPIGKGLLGKQEGDEVTVQTPAGAKSFEITKLLTVHDQVDSSSNE